MGLAFCYDSQRTADAPTPGLLLTVDQDACCSARRVRQLVVNNKHLAENQHSKYTCMVIGVASRRLGRLTNESSTVRQQTA